LLRNRLNLAGGAGFVSRQSRLHKPPAGVTTLTLVIRDLHPTNWWEGERVKNATRVAIGLRMLVLATLAGIILYLGILLL
jgi:hypothetical protein